MGKICKSLVLKQTYESKWTKDRIKQINNGYFAAIHGYDLLIIDITSGETFAKLEAEQESDDTIYDFVVDPLLRYAITSHVSQLLKMWIPQNDEWSVVAQWKCPGRFPGNVQLDPSGQILACSTAASSCYLFSLQNQSLIRRYDIPKGQTTYMTYDSAGHLWIGDNYGHLTVIDHENKKTKVINNEDSHHQAVTSIVSLHPYVITSGLDEVLLVFDTDGDVIQKPVAIMYSINSIVVDPEHQNTVYAATTDGIKRVNISELRILKINSTEVDQLLYFDQLYSFDADGILKTVFNDNPISYSLTFNQIYDISYDEKEDVIAVATSSNRFLIQLLKDHQAYQLYGHENTPLCLTTFNGLLLSGSKDTTAKLWSLTEQKLLCTLIGHTEPVTAVSFIPKSNCVLTGSSDKTLKLWRPVESVTEIKSALASVIAHDKEINTITVSIDGKYIATGSQDKTAKLWKLENDTITYLRTFVGHKRGISSLAFSSVEMVLATSSSDNSIKLWNINDGTCISTFTEFSSTVLRLMFINNGLQLLTCESSGTIKVIRIKTGAPDFINDSSHNGQIWGLSIMNDDYVTAASDGKICVWKDNTEEIEAAELAAKAEAAEAEQELKNALNNDELVKALRIAFKFRMPNKLRLIIRKISESGSDALLQYFTELEEIPDFVQWIDYIAKWTTNSKWADDATEALTALLRVKTLDFFIHYKKEFREKIDAMIPYLERHMGRLDRLAVQAYAIDDVINTISNE